MVMAPVDGGVEIVKGEDKLTLYTFGTGAAKHFFCSRCGIYTHHQTRSNPDKYAINAAILEGLDTHHNCCDVADWTHMFVVDGRNHICDQKDKDKVSNWNLL